MSLTLSHSPTSVIMDSTVVTPSVTLAGTAFGSIQNEMKDTNEMQNDGSSTVRK